MRLVHLSDIHYLPAVSVPARRFLNKRLTGYVNLKFFRSFQHDSGGMLDRVIEALKEAAPDHIAITGDLTNLSLGVEFAELRHLLARLGLPPEDVTVVPGNHDRYTRGSDRANRIRAYLEPYMKSDVDTGGLFPLVRLRGGIALVGIDTALARFPLVAAGRIGRRQLVRIEHALGDDKVRRAFNVLLLHHPPFRRSWHTVGPWLNGLRDYPELYRVLSGRSALLLHGHLHVNSYLRLREEKMDLTVVGVASATRHGRTRPYRLASFHVLDVGPSGISSIARHTLSSDGSACSVSEVTEEEFGTLVPGPGRSRLEVRASKE